MNVQDWLILVPILAGHAGIWSIVLNQVHATAWPRPARKAIEKLIYLIVLTVAALMGYIVLQMGWQVLLTFTIPGALVGGYGLLSLAVLAGLAVRWLFRQVTHGKPDALLQSSCTLHQAAQVELRRQLLHGWQAKLFSWIPGNQITQLALETKTLRMPAAPPASQQITIAHLSDLHFTGKIDRRFFDFVVELCNHSQPSFVCLTGDIVDRPACLEWVEPVLGKLVATHGKFFVLGNHDRRVKEAALRSALLRAGFLGLNGLWHSVQVGKTRLHFAGNELPWYRGAELLAAQPPGSTPSELRILLTHTPDQIIWACRRQFHLVLAGHTHGGQIRFPVIGPIISPSRYGVRFAAGLFQQGATLLHVTRGVSSDDPLRWNCAPELSILKLLTSDLEMARQNEPARH